MSRRVARPRNVLRLPRFLAVFIAVTAVVVGTVAPFELATASASVSAPTSQARALSDPAQTSIVKSSLAGFNAGNIISDAVFTNKSTMTEAQIQSFFNSKVSKCVVGKDEDGKPYVCLKDFKITSVNRVADAYCDGYTGAANESAARIIYRVAQSCDINPQVLIVMLQKEQGLVTHVWPSAWRYNIALGQGCPDTAPCDPGYIGFFHQIYGAARQMQMYMEGRWFNWYAPGNTWQIQYHPDRDRCGTGAVHVANKATSALYYYTPYQPNAAALRANYGEGDTCSSYGNRNFYNYFTDWFGSTQKPAAPAVTVSPLVDLNSTNYVVAADTSGTVWAYAYAKSNWASRVKLTSGLGALSRFFSIGDLTGDMRRDFVAVDAKGQPRLVPGGAGTALGAPTALPGDWSGVIDVIPAGDFNKDGVEDVFSLTASGQLHLRAGNGLGGFAPPTLVGVGWSTMTTILGGVDFDGNGTSDIVARDGKGKLYLYPGTGKGSWGRSVQIGNGWSSMSDIFIPGDFNGDGRADLLAHGADGGLVLYKGTGGGGLAKVGAVGSGWQTMVAKSSGGLKITAPPVPPAGIGNVNGAGGVDIVAAASNGEAFIYGGSGTGGFTSRSKIGNGWGAGDTIVQLGDFDRSGTSDFGRIDAAGNFYLYRGAVGGGFAAPVRIGHGWSGFVHVLGGMDFDGDRIVDTLAVDRAGAMYLYRGSGKGAWIGAPVQVGNGWGTADPVFYAGDFDGDGRGDVIARMSDGTLRLYPIDGGSKWGVPRQIGNGWGAFSNVFTPGDFNGDGAADLIATLPSGLMYLYPGTGSGQFRARSHIGNGWAAMNPVG